MVSRFASYARAAAHATHRSVSLLQALSHPKQPGCALLGKGTAGTLDHERSPELMSAMDTCNARFGRGSVGPARAGLERQR